MGDENRELQAEEREALLAIYEGDAMFRQMDDITYQYKYGEENHFKSFLVEIRWTDKYPNEKPTVNMDVFYNKHLTDAVKSTIATFITNEADQYLGDGMTYSLFEAVREKVDDLVQDQPEFQTDTLVESVKQMDMNEETGGKKTPKKEALTKAQKRRQWDRADGKGENARGWNWIDVVKHLSQTGFKHTE